MEHPFLSLPSREKEPSSATMLTNWIQQAQAKTNVPSDRLSWLVASTVVVAALQRALHNDGQPRFVLKGGVYLEHRLGLNARATKDVDTLFRGDFADFLSELDSALQEPWGVLTLQRGDVTVIEGVRNRVKPRRFDVRLLIRGKVWRRIQVEVAPEEGRAGINVDMLAAPPLNHFGLPSPGQLAGIVLDYQVAQKLHACTDPHSPPSLINDRVRDVVDLVLLRQSFYQDLTDFSNLANACLDIFQTRAAEAEAAGYVSRPWPPVIVSYPHWEVDYLRPAEQAGFQILLKDAIKLLNTWIDEISRSAR